MIEKRSSWLPFLPTSIALLRSSCLLNMCIFLKTGEGTSPVGLDSYDTIHVHFLPKHRVGSLSDPPDMTSGL